MLLDRYQRFFVRHELRFRPARNNGLPLPFCSEGNRTDVQDVLNAAIAARKADLSVKKRDVVRLVKLDVRANDNLAVLLFRRSDPDAANPVFENVKTRKLRPADKTEDEAVAVSAHLFIHLAGIHDAAYPTYPAILEEVPGLSRTYVQTLLGDILREAKYEFTDKRGEKAETYTLIDFLGVKSETLTDALKNSSIPYVELVRPGNISGLDTEGLVVPQEERMKLMLKATPAQTPALLKRLNAWRKEKHWEDIRVQVRMPENRSRVVSIAREADAADVLFIRAEAVNVKEALQPCTDVINEELVTKAREMFAGSKG